MSKAVGQPKFRFEKLSQLLQQNYRYDQLKLKGKEDNPLQNLELELKKLNQLFPLAHLPYQVFQPILQLMMQRYLEVDEVYFRKLMLLSLQPASQNFPQLVPQFQTEFVNQFASLFQIQGERQVWLENRAGIERLLKLSSHWFDSKLGGQLIHLNYSLFCSYFTQLVQVNYDLKLNLNLSLLYRVIVLLYLRCKPNLFPTFDLKFYPLVLRDLKREGLLEEEVRSISHCTIVLVQHLDLELEEMGRQLLEMLSYSCELKKLYLIHFLLTNFKTKLLQPYPGGPFVHPLIEILKSSLNVVPFQQSLLLSLCKTNFHLTFQLLLDNLESYEVQLDLKVVLEIMQDNFKYWDHLDDSLSLHTMDLFQSVVRYLAATLPTLQLEALVFQLTKEVIHCNPKLKSKYLKLKVLFQFLPTEKLFSWDEDIFDTLAHGFHQLSLFNKVTETILVLIKQMGNPTEPTPINDKVKFDRLYRSLVYQLNSKDERVKEGILNYLLPQLITQFKFNATGVHYLLEKVQLKKDQLQLVCLGQMGKWEPYRYLSKLDSVPVQGTNLFQLLLSNVQSQEPTLRYLSFSILLKAPIEPMQLKLVLQFLNLGFYFDCTNLRSKFLKLIQQFCFQWKRSWISSLNLNLNSKSNFKSNQYLDFFQKLVSICLNHTSLNSSYTNTITSIQILNGVGDTFLNSKLGLHWESIQTRCLQLSFNNYKDVASCSWNLWYNIFKTKFNPSQPVQFTLQPQLLDTLNFCFTNLVLPNLKIRLASLDVLDHFLNLFYDNASFLTWVSHQFHLDLDLVDEKGGLEVLNGLMVKFNLSMQNQREVSSGLELDRNLALIGGLLLRQLHRFQLQNQTVPPQLETLVRTLISSLSKWTTQLVSLTGGIKIKLEESELIWRSLKLSLKFQLDLLPCTKFVQFTFRLDILNRVTYYLNTLYHPGIYLNLNTDYQNTLHQLNLELPFQTHFQTHLVSDVKQSVQVGGDHLDQRSKGLPLSTLAKLQVVDKRVVDEGIQLLLHFAQLVELNQLHRTIHALNILRSLILDRQLSPRIFPTIYQPLLRICKWNFQLGSIWQLNSATLLLYSTVLYRLIHLKNTNLSDATTKVDYCQLISTYPIEPLLLEMVAWDKVNFGLLFSTLALFTRVQFDSLDLASRHQLCQVFTNKIGHPDLRIRQYIADLLIQLTLPNQLRTQTQRMMNLVETSLKQNRFNSVHGGLLYLNLTVTERMRQLNSSDSVTLESMLKAFQTFFHRIVPLPNPLDPINFNLLFHTFNQLQALEPTLFHRFEAKLLTTKLPGQVPKLNYLFYLELVKNPNWTEPDYLVYFTQQSAVPTEVYSWILNQVVKLNPIKLDWIPPLLTTFTCKPIPTHLHNLIFDLLSDKLFTKYLNHLNGLSKPQLEQLLRDLDLVLNWNLNLNSKLFNLTLPIHHLLKNSAQVFRCVQHLLTLSNSDSQLDLRSLVIPILPFLLDTYLKPEWVQPMDFQLVESIYFLTFNLLQDDQVELRDQVVQILWTQHLIPQESLDQIVLAQLLEPFIQFMVRWDRLEPYLESLLNTTLEDSYLFNRVEVQTRFEMERSNLYLNPSTFPLLLLEKCRSKSGQLNLNLASSSSWKVQLDLKLELWKQKLQQQLVQLDPIWELKWKVALAFQTLLQPSALPNPPEKLKLDFKG